MPGKYFGPSQIQIRHPPLDSCLLSLDFSGWAWDEDRKLKTSVHMVFKARGKSEIRQEDYGGRSKPRNVSREGVEEDEVAQEWSYLGSSYFFPLLSLPRSIFCSW